MEKPHLSFPHLLLFNFYECDGLFIIKSILLFLNELGALGKAKKVMT